MELQILLDLLQADGLFDQLVAAHLLWLVAVERQAQLWQQPVLGLLLLLVVSQTLLQQCFGQEGSSPLCVIW